MATYPLGSEMKSTFFSINSNSKFGASRPNGKMHAGYDLAGTPGTPVYAVAHGMVLYKNFYSLNTFALVIHHFSFVARYAGIGRILPDNVKTGYFITEGQHIANIGKSNISSGLHFEIYQGTTAGRLTQKSNTKYDFVEGSTYQRRSDLLDPTSLLKDSSPYLGGGIEGTDVFSY